MVYPDAVNTTIFSSAGVAAAQWALVNSLGIPFGPTGVIGNGLDEGLSRYIGVKRAGTTQNEPRMVDVTGDNGRFRHKYMFNAAEIGNLEMNFGPMNMVLATAAAGTKIRTYDDWEFMGMETDAGVGSNQVCLVISVDAQDADAASGTKRYWNYLYPLVTLTPLFGTHEEATGMEYPWRGAPTQAARAPWGEPFTEATWGFSRAAYIGGVSTSYPITLHTFVRNGTTTAFTLNHMPASDHTGTAVKVWNTTPAGVNTRLAAGTDFTVNVAAQTVTLSAAGTAGHIVVVAYEAIDLLD
jgi:hypothetical protein